jgi:hypothetical protein
MKNTIQPIAEAPVTEEELPVRVQDALGELAAAAREGLLALSVGVGLGVLAELMEEEVVEVVGTKGKHDRERVAVRHGHEAAVCARQVGDKAVRAGGCRIAVAASPPAHPEALPAGRARESNERRPSASDA